MRDRGMVKWLPFESVVSSKTVLKDILNEKEKIKKPVLSLEQLEDIQISLWDAFHTQSEISITYYWNGFIKKKEAFILEVIPSFKKVLFSDHSQLYFEQILKIEIT